ncbi:MAG: hypothetical protein M3347_14490 [Armatimonadota bacterium]|nr:hypothetical protein [Armatimonadota bacterium]
MLTSVKGTYRHGQIELQELPVDVQDETPVIVTFLGDEVIDLPAQGIGPQQAVELRAALATFEDWNAPEMDIYNDYDAATAKL